MGSLIGKSLKAPKWILVVEKYAVYERLMKCKYGYDDGGLVLTGRGIPDRATRNLLSGWDLQTCTSIFRTISDRSFRFDDPW